MYIVNNLSTRSCFIKRLHRTLLEGLWVEWCIVSTVNCCRDKGAPRVDEISIFSQILRLSWHVIAAYLFLACAKQAWTTRTYMYVFGKKGCVVSRLGILPLVQWPIIPLKKFIIPISISLKDERVMAICMLATEIDILTNSIDTQKGKKIGCKGWPY